MGRSGSSFLSISVGWPSSITKNAISSKSSRPATAFTSAVVFGPIKRVSRSFLLWSPQWSECRETAGPSRSADLARLSFSDGTADTPLAPVMRNCSRVSRPWRAPAFAADSPATTPRYSCHRSTSAVGSTSRHPCWPGSPSSTQSRRAAASFMSGVSASERSTNTTVEVTVSRTRSTSAMISADKAPALPPNAGEYRAPVLAPGRWHRLLLLGELPILNLYSSCAPSGRITVS